ncbi:MAG: PEP-CTERM sorting domain-containing protein [Alphaproteobacteria bacterium]|nr:PEP-CTERM sorting domain-containing protein [Alphaproteobacteria bacterium]
MKSLKLIATTCCIGVAAMAFSANAVPINGSATGLTTPDVIIDFEAGSLPNATVVTNQFSGITFGTNYNLFTGGAAPNISGRFLGDVGSTGPGSIFFDNDASDAGFFFRTNTTTTTFTALLDGVLVESFAASTSLSNSSNFYGFTDIVFDEIQISVAVGGYNLDGLQFSDAAVSEPGSLVVFGLGLIGLGAIRRRRMI